MHMIVHEHENNKLFKISTYYIHAWGYHNFFSQVASRGQVDFPIFGLLVTSWRFARLQQ